MLNKSMIERFAGLISVKLSEKEDAVVILDQTELPSKELYLTLTTPEEIWDAIYKLKVRGAPAIGIAAAYGIYVCARNIKAADREEFISQFKSIKEYLAGCRPTAVNLIAALNRMENAVTENPDSSIAECIKRLHDEALAIREEDAKACHMIGENCLKLLKPGMGLLTHCNAGHLATSEYGTALAPIYLGEERGYKFKVYADETRPLLQGARLTAYELQKAGVDVTLVCDNMASTLMSQGKIDAVLVGCDRVAANGDVANKIGTSGLAVMAKHYGIPFYVLGPTSTIDMDCERGDNIRIEERDPDEVTEMWYSQRMAPKGVAVYNPAFDVTPNELVTAIITENGLFDKNIR